MANLAPNKPATMTGVIRLEQRYGWRHSVQSGLAVWLKGQLWGTEESDLAATIAAAWPLTSDNAPTLLQGLHGHFALVAAAGGHILAAVDRIRSIPLFYTGHGSAAAVTADPTSLVDEFGVCEIDSEAALALAMAGFTIGRDTLYQHLHQLAPGEFVLLAPAADPVRRRYHRYEPWRATAEQTHAALAETTLEILSRIVADAHGRTIAVPLSAGLDSRVVVSGLAHLGARNVKCFAYGLPGNYEARASQCIAAHLGYPWHSVPFTPKSQRRFSQSRVYRDYLAFADPTCATPVVHDLPAICTLLDSGYLPADAIIINGNSGDYITGLHIPPALRRPRGDLDEPARRALLVDAMIDKHFHLWDSLATPANRRRIAARLEQELTELPPEALLPTGLHGAHEWLELRDRQSKYVIARQRIYEFLGLDWRLPLWDDAYLDFWQSVPLSQKAGQRLYREMAEQANWGGVWQGSQWQFPSRVEPAWIRGPRQLLRLAHAPLGKDRWHRFERRYLSYWMDVFAWQAIMPYRQVIADTRGARHLVAWHTQAYLQSKGLTYAGAPD